MSSCGNLASWQKPSITKWRPLSLKSHRFSRPPTATDQNQLTMELIQRIAKNITLVALLHEKPFEGINGSGKHNNWSLSTNTGLNLLEPGDTPYENLQFLTFWPALSKLLTNTGSAPPFGSHRRKRSPSGCKRSASGYHLHLYRRRTRGSHRSDQSRCRLRKQGQAVHEHRCPRSA